MHRCDIGNYVREYKTDMCAGVNNVRGIEFHSLIVDGIKTDVDSYVGVSYRRSIF